MATSRSYRSIVIANTFTVFNLILAVFGAATLAFGDPKDALFPACRVCCTQALLRNLGTALHDVLSSLFREAGEPDFRQFFSLH